MTIAAGNVLKLTAKLTLPNAGQCQNVYYVEVTDIAGQNQLQIRTAIGRYLDAIYVAIDTHMDTNVEPDIIDIYNLSADTAEPSVNFNSFAGGTGAAQGLPPQNSVMIRGTTNVKRREARKYMPPVTEVDQENGIVNAGTLTDYATAGAAWIADYIDGTNGVTLNPVVVRALAPLVFSPLQSALINAVIDTQRRRKQGVGI